MSPGPDLRTEMAKAVYERWCGGTIGCCDPSWDELDDIHRARLIDSMDAGIAVACRHLRDEAERERAGGHVAGAQVLERVAAKIEKDR